MRDVVAKNIWPSSIGMQMLAEDKKLLSNLGKKDLWLSKDKDLKESHSNYFLSKLKCWIVKEVNSDKNPH